MMNRASGPFEKKLVPQAQDDAAGGPLEEDACNVNEFQRPPINKFPAREPLYA